jgi:very-short-patch-repair endonuclease
VVVGRVVRDAGSELGPAALGWAAVLAAGRTAVASHDTAAALWGLAGSRPAPLHATASRGQHRRIEGLVVHRAALSPDDVVAIEGRLPATSLGRTLVDCLLAWEPDRSRHLLTEALRRRVVDEAALARLVRDSAGRHGHAAAVRALREVCRGAWSDGEVRLHALFRRARLPGWVANAAVVDAEGLIGYADVLFRVERVVVELDGRTYHDDPVAFQRDRARQNRLVLAGYTVLRFTWHDVVQRPDHVLAVVRGALARAA